MDFGAEIINISKIKDSFFIGDKVAGTNLDVLLQFKISHIINAAGNQIFNYFLTTLKSIINTKLLYNIIFRIKFYGSILNL